MSNSEVLVEEGPLSSQAIVGQINQWVTQGGVSFTRELPTTLLARHVYEQIKKRAAEKIAEEQSDKIVKPVGADVLVPELVAFFKENWPSEEALRNLMKRFEFVGENADLGTGEEGYYFLSTHLALCSAYNEVRFSALFGEIETSLKINLFEFGLADIFSVLDQLPLTTLEGLMRKTRELADLKVKEGEEQTRVEAVANLVRDTYIAKLLSEAMHSLSGSGNLGALNTLFEKKYYDVLTRMSYLQLRVLKASMDDAMKKVSTGRVDASLASLEAVVRKEMDSAAREEERERYVENTRNILDAKRLLKTARDKLGEAIHCIENGDTTKEVFAQALRTFLKKRDPESIRLLRQATSKMTELHLSRIQHPIFLEISANLSQKINEQVITPGELKKFEMALGQQLESQVVYSDKLEALLKEALGQGSLTEEEMDRLRTLSHQEAARSAKRFQETRGRSESFGPSFNLALALGTMLPVEEKKDRHSVRLFPSKTSVVVPAPVSHTQPVVKTTATQKSESLFEWLARKFYTFFHSSSSSVAPTSSMGLGSEQPQTESDLYRKQTLENS